MKTIGLISQELLFRINKTYLLIVLVLCICSCNLIKGQQKSDFVTYDSLSQKEVYTFVEKMPFYKGGEAAFISDFSRRFRPVYSDTEPKQTILKVQYVIDKEGHLIGARIYNKKEGDKLSAFEENGLKALNLMQNWQAGIHEDKAVNVILTRVIHVDINHTD